MSTDLNFKIALNEQKLKDLSQKVLRALEQGIPFRILGLDIDNTLINDNPIRTRMLKDILKEEYDVTMQRANDLFLTGKPDDIALSSILIGNMLDKVYEEGEPKFVGKMDYKQIYRLENFFPGAIDFVRYLLMTKGEYDFVVLVSHKNVLREAHDKIDLMYDTFPEIDGIYLPNYHDDPFGIAGRQAVSKIEFMNQTIIFYFNLPSIKNIKINIKNNIFLSDDSSTVLLDTLSRGGNIVPFLPSRIPIFNPNRNYFDDFLARAARSCDMEQIIAEKSSLDAFNKTLIK